MNKIIDELFWSINSMIDKFIKKYPDLRKNEVALNVIAMFSGTLVNITTKDQSLEEKFKLLDDLLQQEKKWIEFAFWQQKDMKNE